MSRRKRPAKPAAKRVTKKTEVPKRDLLDVAVRPLQLIHAVAVCTERSATHDLVELGCVSDAAAAFVKMVEQVLDELDQLEASSGSEVQDGRP